MLEPDDVAGYRRDCDETEREGAESQSPTSRVVVPVLTSHLRGLLDDKERADHAAGVLNRVWDALGGEFDGEFDQKDIADLATNLERVVEAARVVSAICHEQHLEFVALVELDVRLARLQGSEVQP